MRVRKQTRVRPPFLFFHQKWCSNGTNKQETEGRSQTACVSVKWVVIKLRRILSRVPLAFVMLKPFSAICKGVLEDGRSVVKLEMSKSHYNFPKSRNMQIGSKIGQLIPEMADWKIGEAKHFSVVCQCRLWQRVMSIKSLFPGEKVNIAKCFGFCDCCYVTVSEFSHHDTLLGNGGNIQSYP